MLIKYFTGHVYTAAADSHFPGSEYTIPEKKKRGSTYTIDNPLSKEKKVFSCSSTLTV
jgi:hypothetical protein